MAATMPLISVFACAILALFLTLPKTGNNNPARMAMMAMTTSNSIRVKARKARCERDLVISLPLQVFRFRRENSNDGARETADCERLNPQSDRRAGKLTVTRGVHARSDQSTHKRRAGRVDLGEVFINKKDISTRRLKALPGPCSSC